MGYTADYKFNIAEPLDHGEAETASYVLSGRIKVWFGEDFKESIEAGPGDFTFVPAHFPT